MILSPPAGARRAEILVAFGALAALTCLLFAPALKPGAVLYFRDVSQNHHPYRQLTASMIAAGEAPLWNPLRGAGQPLLANPNALVLHPTTLLFVALPFEAAFKASVILQFFLAGAGAWLLLRDIGAGGAARLLGASLFSFTGYMASLGNLINLLDSASFMPMTLWLAGRAAARGFAPWGSLAALSLAVQVMTGEPAMLLCTAAAFAALRWSYPRGGASGPARGPTARLAAVAGVALLGLALSTIATLPSIELLSQSERGAGFDRAEALKWSQPPLALLEAALPRLFGDPTRTDIARFWGGGLFDAGLPFILSIYLGPGALILAARGLAAARGAGGPRRAETIALGSLAVGGAALAMGRFLPLYPALLSALAPLESVRYPVKYLLMTTWALSVLAARGYDRLASVDGGRRTGAAGGGGRWRPLILPGAALGASAVGLATDGFGLGAWLARGALRIPEGLATPERVAAIAGGIGFSAAWAGGVAAWMLFWIGRPPGPISKASLLLAPILEPMLWTIPLNPVAPESFYSERPAIARLVEGAGGNGRLWAAPRPRGFAFRAPAEEADSLRWGFRWDRMTLRNASYFPYGMRFAFDRGNERLDVMPGAAVARALAGTETTPVRPDAMARLLSLACVDRVIAYGGLDLPGFAEAGRLEGESNVPVVLMRNQAAMPRAWVVSRAETIPDLGMALRRLDDPSFDPREMVIVEQGGAAGDGGAGAAHGAARILEESPGRVLVQASSAAPGHLVVADTFYPGWEARVDGEPADLVRANAMFRAVAVPAGTHRVEFLYRPSTVRSGLMVSAAALLLAGLLAIPRRR